MFSLESPHRGDSYEYTQYTNFNIKKTITQNYSKSAAMGFCSKGLQNEFKTAVVKEPSVFEPLKFYCIYFFKLQERSVFIWKCLSCIPWMATLRVKNVLFKELIICFFKRVLESKCCSPHKLFRCIPMQ